MRVAAVAFILLFLSSAAIAQEQDRLFARSILGLFKRDISKTSENPTNHPRLVTEGANNWFSMNSGKPKIGVRFYYVGNVSDDNLHMLKSKSGSQYSERKIISNCSGP